MMQNLRYRHVLQGAAAALSLKAQPARGGFTAMLQAMALLGLVTVLSVPTSSTAAVVTVSATEFPHGALISENFTVKGFRFSPSCHVDVFQLRDIGLPADRGITIAGIDGSGCFQEPPTQNEENFLGPADSGVAFYIDAGGRPFTLLKLEFWQELEILTSSKGGEFSGRPPPFDPDLGDLTDVWTETFDGGKWTGIKWLMWLYPNNPGDPSAGIINLTLRVPEPGMLALLSLGLAGLAFTRRRKQ